MTTANRRLVPIRTTAMLVGRHPATVRRWVDEGLVAAEVSDYSDRRLVDTASLARHVGRNPFDAEDYAQADELLHPEREAQRRRNAALSQARRAVAYADRALRVAADEPDPPAETRPQTPAPSVAAPIGLNLPMDEAVAAFRKLYVTAQLHRHAGSIHAAARAAGVERANFKRVLARLGIDPNEFRSPEA